MPQKLLRVLTQCLPDIDHIPGKQKRPRRAAYKSLISLKNSGAGEGIRTLDPNLGKVVLYP